MLLMAVALDKLARPVRDLRISVTDRCNFRCVYCMPKEVFGEEFAVPAPWQLLTFEEIDAAGAHVRRDGCREAAHDRRRAAAALAAWTSWSHASPPLPGIDDLTLTTNGALLARMAQALADAGLKRVTVRLDSLDDATFRAMNDVDFPVADVLDGIDARLRGGPRAVKVNMVVKRGINDDEHLPWPALPRARATSSASSSTWTSARPTAGGWTMSCPRPRSWRAIDAELAARAGRPAYRGEVPARYRYRDGGGEIGHDLVGHAAVLR